MGASSLAEARRRSSGGARPRPSWRRCDAEIEGAPAGVRRALDRSAGAARWPTGEAELAAIAPPRADRCGRLSTMPNCSGPAGSPPRPLDRRELQDRLASGAPGWRRRPSGALRPRPSRGRAAAWRAVCRLRRGRPRCLARLAVERERISRRGLGGCLACCNGAACAGAEAASRASRARAAGRRRRRLARAAGHRRARAGSVGRRAAAARRRDPRPRSGLARGRRGQLGRAAGRGRRRARALRADRAAPPRAGGPGLAAAGREARGRRPVVARDGWWPRSASGCEPLLQRVFPGAEPVFDPECLSLTHLRRDGAEEAFDSLSVGAREQLAVLVRLAFAAPAGRARGRGAVPDPRRRPGLCRRSPVRDHEGDPAACGPARCRFWC